MTLWNLSWFLQVRVNISFLNYAQIQRGGGRIQTPAGKSQVAIRSSGILVWTPLPLRSSWTFSVKLEDLKVLKRSPDLLNNVKIGQGQLRLIMETYFVLPYMGVAANLVK